MFKRVVVILVLVGIFNVSPGVAEVEQFRFSNWPLADFEQREVLKPSGEEHFGADIKAEVGEEVFAAANGIVYWTYSGGANGIAAGIEHENGWRTTYLHLSERSVKKGQSVKAGDIIGKVGITGTGRDSEAPHLHFGLIKNPAADINNPFERYANPLDFGPLIQTPITREQSVEQLTEQPDSQQIPAPQILTPVSEQLTQLLIKERTSVLENLPTTSVAAARMQKKLRQSSRLKTQPSPEHAAVVKKPVIARKPAIVRKSISLEGLTAGWEIFKVAGGRFSTRTVPEKASYIVGRARRARLDGDGSHWTKLYREPSPIKRIALLFVTPLALLLANLIRKSYNIVLT